MQSNGLCTGSIKVGFNEPMKIREERIEIDEETQTHVLIASVARSKMDDCAACDALVPSDRLYFAALNDVGGGDIGWKGYEETVFVNRSIGAVFDMILGGEGE